MFTVSSLGIPVLPDAWPCHRNNKYAVSSDDTKIVVVRLRLALFNTMFLPKVSMVFAIFRMAHLLLVVMILMVAT